MKVHIARFFVLSCFFLLFGCDQKPFGMYDGYYTAEAAKFDVSGWKEFVTIYVSNNTIVTVEYNAKNVSGFLKSWDVDYMRKMKSSRGTYPNKYIRAYAAALLNRQETAGIPAVAGAVYHQKTFQLLANAAMEQAKTGKKNIVFVDLPSRYILEP